MADISFKKDDTWPPLTATLSDLNGPIDLTGATVRLILKGATVTISGVCTLVDADAGQVKYTWAGGDLATAGEYNGEFEITLPSGKVETVPNGGYFTLEIVADLD